MNFEEKFKSKEELFKFLVANKNQLIAAKKFEMKCADSFAHSIAHVYEKEGANKEEGETQDLLSQDTITAKLVINTTGLFDSHRDVHIKGLWKKSLKEIKLMYHLQEHQMSFDHIISDRVKASTENIAWKDLGADYEGETEALIFTSEIDKQRNEFMFYQYAKNYVRNHSVGMRYVQLFLCINSEEENHKGEKANWNKYIGEVANREEVEDVGYFWAVTEAKLIEGSAVPMGSNWVTPTQSIKIEPSADTQEQEPDTPLLKKGIDLKKINLVIN
jgi:hypothetical protein